MKYNPSAAPDRGPKSPYYHLQDRGDPLARVLQLANDAIISVDQNQRIILFNQRAEKMFGYSAREILSQPIDLLLPLLNMTASHRKNIETAVRSEMSERGEITARRRDGSEFPAEASISKIDTGGEIMFTVMMRDVTQRTLADLRLKSSLHEKEVLLEEIHHRVKNNLQVVSSLLGLQARAIADRDTRKKFEESQYRIQSMALLHEHLYQSEDLARIDFAEYIGRLAEQLFRFYESSHRIRLKTDLQPLHFDMDTAVPCGLIVNELLSNSLKYGFPADKEGEVLLELRQASASTVRLLVADNGEGLPANFDWKTSRTLGLRLVRTLAEQLSGSVELYHQPGTAFAVSFPSAGVRRTE